MSAQAGARVGAIVHQVVAGPGGRGIDADIEVTDYVVPTRYAFKTIAGPVRPAGSYTFAPEGERTKVTFTLAAELHGLKKLIMGPAVQKSMDSEMAALDSAKTLLEG